MVLAPTNAMPHHHHWQSEPPDGKFTWCKSWDERYGDEEDMAANAMSTSPEEIIRLRLELKKDPDYAASSNWPSLVEWCSTCTTTRLVRLVLSEEEHEAVAKEEVEEETMVDFTWTRRRQAAVKPHLRMPAPKLRGGGAEAEKGVE